MNVVATLARAWMSGRAHGLATVATEIDATVILRPILKPPSFPGEDHQTLVK